MTKFYWPVAVTITIGLFIVSAALYPKLPEQIPTHWNIRGEVDDYGAKQWAAFLMPGVITGMLVVFWFLPWLSPKRFEVDSFKSTYLFLMVLLVGFLGYLHAVMLIQATDGGVDMNRAIVGGVSLFFLLLGNVLGKVRRNFYIGVRTPWTLASERVWTDTHRVAAWMFAACGLLALVLVFLPVSIWFSISLLIVPAVVSILYSLIHYKQLERRGEV